ncbi:Uncharacterised protein [Neisseria gonorrhoeae]|uniref:Uncharacterized protein n=1 Tax=Neisseria gonorrhoeae TaxID=485 RepID=A0A378VV40_NEIGO|nr:Uncharacterised protein [Neisseria gonorrhoeae]
MLFEQVGETAQAGGAFGGRCRTPFGERGNGCTNRFLGKRGIGKADRTDNIAVVGRVLIGCASPTSRALPLTMDAAWKSCAAALFICS